MTLERTNSEEVRSSTGKEQDQCGLTESYKLRSGIPDHRAVVNLEIALHPLPR